jgi:hypothetical protein
MFLLPKNMGRKRGLKGCNLNIMPKKHKTVATPTFFP